MLREGDPALGRGRARDLRDDAAVRDAARERRRSTRPAGSTSERGEDREHPRRLPARGDLELAAGEARRPPEQRRLPDRRRLRRHAAARAADRARRPRTTSSPASRPSSPAPRSASPSRRRPSRRASAGRSCRSRRPSTRGCWARSCSSTGRPCGSSTPAGPAARPATAGTGCRSPRRGRCCTPRSPARSTAPRCAPTPSSGSRCRWRCRASTRGLLDPRSTWDDPAAYDAKARGARAALPRELRALRRRRPRGRRGGPGCLGARVAAFS